MRAAKSNKKRIFDDKSSKINYTSKTNIMQAYIK